MTFCLCGLLAAVLSAGSADLATTAQFTALDGRELNPIAKPFVSGRGARGEVWLGALTGSGYLLIDQTAPEPWRSLVLGAAFAAHTTAAILNVQRGRAHEVPPILFPVLMLRF